MRTLRRGEAAAAAHWPDFGSSSAVVHESESGSSVCYSRQAGRVWLAVQLVARLDCIRPGSWGGIGSQFFLVFLVFPFVSEGFVSAFSFLCVRLFFSVSSFLAALPFLLFPFDLFFSFSFFSSSFFLDCLFLA